MEKDREWPEDDIDWSFKIQDEKQLEQCLQMKTIYTGISLKTHMSVQEQ